MAIDRDTLLLFDASCLVAAAGSPTGGSSFLLSVCARGFLRGVVSQPILLEAERNVLDHLGSEALARYHRLLATTPLDVVSLPPLPDIASIAPAINPKDAHVVAAALRASAPYLISLDKGLLRQVSLANLPLIALSPGEFIVTVLPNHCDYPSMR